MGASSGTTPSAPSSGLSGISVLIGTTLFEVAGLIIWMEFQKAGKTGGLVIMFAGLVLERLVITGLKLNKDQWLTLLASAWWEYAAWALWFTLIARGAGPIGVLALVLFPGLHGQHAFSIAMREGRPFGPLIRHPGFIAFGLIEAVGGALWLLALTGGRVSTVVAHAIIVVAITVEHIVQGAVLHQLNSGGRVLQMGKAH